MDEVIGTSLFSFGDEENVPPKQLIPNNTTLELRIVGVPKIQAGQGQPSEKYPNGYRYARIRGNCLPVDEQRYADCEFISLDLGLPSPDDPIARQNDAKRQLQSFCQAVGWTSPRGKQPVDGMEFPELKDATFTAKVRKVWDDYRGADQNEVGQFVVEKGV